VRLFPFGEGLGVRPVGADVRPVEAGNEVK